MKTQIAFILLVVFIGVSCKNKEQSSVQLEENTSISYDQNDGLITMRGNYVYHNGAAVLETPNTIYGVVINADQKILEEQVAPFKKEPTDMVPVTVRVKRFKKPENEVGWDFRVEIKEILKVEEPQEINNNVIKLTQ